MPHARVLGLTLLLPAAALAVTPPEGGPWQGREPGHVRTTSPDAQAFWASQPAWRRFTDGVGRGWTATFDETTGRPLRAWGPPIPLGDPRTGDAVLDAILDLVDGDPALWGVEAAELVPRPPAQDPATGTWYVQLDSWREGMPVYRAGLTFRVRHGALVMAGAETWPDAPIDGPVQVDPAAARATALDRGPVSTGRVTARPRALLVPEVRGGRAHLRPVWEVRVRSEVPVGDWSVLVDARTGDVATWFNHVRFAAGRVDAEHDPRLAGPPLVSPLRNAEVGRGPDRATTDDDGAWSVPDETAPELRLDGPRLVIDDELGNARPELPSGEHTVVASDEGFSPAALTTFHYIQEVQDFARGLAPEVPWVDARAEVYVNLDNTCNAWFDGTLNFLRESDACRNTGRQADVIFHEWGHGFHDASLLAGAYDFSLGEGAADTLAMLKNRDSRIAPGFFFQGTDALRDTLNTRRYPDDYTPDQTYIHQNGLIFGGSMWDVKEALQRTMGEDEAYATLARIFVRMLKGGPTLETAYAEALLADDVDGDLSNGTPNQCALVEGFGLHGLGPQGGQDVAPLHAVPESLTAEVLPLRVELPDPAPTCLELVAHSATLHWRVDDGPWQQIPMVLDGQEVRASLPVDDLAPGTLVSYWSELETSLGHTVSDPTGGPIRPHTLHVGGLLPIWCQDFEADDGDFRHSLVGGEDVDGADDWAWGTPIGLSGDPAGAASGSKAWGNDLGGGRFDGAYQNEKHNRLASPKLPTFHYDGVLLRYQRWLTVEDGFYDHATILADGVEVWSNHASGADVGDEHHLDDRWEPHTVPLRGQADDGEVKLAWELRTDQGFQAGGWTLDDVCLHAPDTPDNRLGMNDFTARRDADSTTVRLSWTMPRHDPVDEVVVVRKRGAWPTGPTDGDQVFRTTRITLEAPATAVDEEASGVDLYYAAYARDGRTWLSWTREGFNAASVDPRPPGEDPEGCGCATGSSSRSGLLALMLGLPLWHRRRPPARPLRDRAHRLASLSLATHGFDRSLQSPPLPTERTPEPRGPHAMASHTDLPTDAVRELIEPVGAMSGRLPAWLRLVHWAIILNLLGQWLYGGWQVFVVLAPDGVVGPMFGAAAKVPYELMMARRMYALEAWVAFLGLAVYLGVTEVLPRRSGS